MQAARNHWVKFNTGVSIFLSFFRIKASNDANAVKSVWPALSNLPLLPLSLAIACDHVGLVDVLATPFQPVEIAQ